MILADTRHRLTRNDAQLAARLLAADGRVTLAARDRAARNGREQPWRP